MKNEKVLNSATDSAAYTATTATVGIVRTATESMKGNYLHEDVKSVPKQPGNKIVISNFSSSHIPIGDVPFSNAPISDIPVNDVLMSKVSVVAVPISHFPSSGIATINGPISNVPISNTSISNILTSNVRVNNLSNSDNLVSDIAAVDVSTSNVPFHYLPVNHATCVSRTEENKLHVPPSIERQKQNCNDRDENYEDCNNVNKGLENIHLENCENKPNLREGKKLIENEKTEICPNFDIDHHELTRISFKAKMDWWISEIENGNR